MIANRLGMVISSCGFSTPKNALSLLPRQLFKVHPCTPEVLHVVVGGRVKVDVIFHGSFFSKTINSALTLMTQLSDARDAAIAHFHDPVRTTGKFLVVGDGNYRLVMIVHKLVQQVEDNI